MSTGTCMWMSYTLVACTALAIPAVALIQERHNRSNVDEVVMDVG